MRLNLNQPRRLSMGVKFQNKNQNDNPRTVLLDSLITPYAHILLHAYVLIKQNLPIGITFMYEDLTFMKLDRLYLVLSEWGELTVATLLWFLIFDFLYHQNQRHQRSSGSHIPRPRAVKIAFGEFTRSTNSDALQ